MAIIEKNPKLRFQTCQKLKVFFLNTAFKIFIENPMSQIASAGCTHQDATIAPP